MKRLRQFLETFSRAQLPGSEAQAEMSGFGRPQVDQPEDARAASVLLYIFPDRQDEYRMCFIKRTSRFPSDPHAGQIAFPGGQRESRDKSHWHTAIREAQEEVGISPLTTKKLGPLSQLYIPISNFIVYPFLSITEEEPQFRLQESEVEAIITPKVIDILDEKNLQYRDLKVAKNRVLPNVPHFYLENQIIWGATAMILNEFKASALAYEH